MPRESVEAKAVRLLAAGRVKVDAADEVRAVVRGDHGIYVVSVTANGGECNCRSRGRCSHVAAVALIADCEPHVGSFEPGGRAEEPAAVVFPPADPAATVPAEPALLESRGRHHSTTEEVTLRDWI